MKSDSSFRIEIIITAILALVFLVFFSYVLARHFTAPPSPGMSREIRLGDVEMADYGVFRDHVAVASGPDPGTFLVVAVDGNRTRGFTLDARGGLLAESAWDLDLSSEARITADSRDDGSPVVFAGGRDLRRCVLPSGGGSADQEVVITDIDGFAASGPLLLVNRSDGLWGWNDVSDRLEGPILDTAVERLETVSMADGVLAALVVSRGADRFDLRIVGLDRDFRITSDRTVLRDTIDDRFRHLRDIHVRGGTAFLLFTRKDNKYGRNDITVLEIPGVGGIREYRARIPLRSGRFRFIHGVPDTGTESTASPPPIVFRWDSVFGSNLAMARWSGGNGISDFTITPLTKTRALSVLAGFRAVDGNRVLVFSDVVGNRRSLSIATDHPDIVAESTRWIRAEWGSVAGTTLLHAVLALFFGGVAFMITAPPALLTVSLLDRIRRSFRHREAALVALGLVIHTGFQLFVTRYFLVGTMQGTFAAPVIGEAPTVYVFVGVLNLAAYLLSLPRYADSSVYRDPATGILTRILILETVLYSMGFLIYGVTTMLIAKL